MVVWLGIVRGWRGRRLGGIFEDLEFDIRWEVDAKSSRVPGRSNTHSLIDLSGVVVLKWFTDSI